MYFGEFLLLLVIVCADCVESSKWGGGYRAADACIDHPDSLDLPAFSIRSRRITFLAGVKGNVSLRQSNPNFLFRFVLGAILLSFYYTTVLAAGGSRGFALKPSNSSSAV